jgi:hypothetical protein
MKRCVKIWLAAGAIATALVGPAAQAAPRPEAAGLSGSAAAAPLLQIWRDLVERVSFFAQQLRGWAGGDPGVKSDPLDKQGSLRDPFGRAGSLGDPSGNANTLRDPAGKAGSLADPAGTPSVPGSTGGN